MSIRSLPSSEKDEKALEIEACFSKESVDLWHLRELSLSRGGLLKGKLRQKGWMQLVGLPVEETNDDVDLQDMLDNCEFQIKRLERKAGKKPRDKKERPVVKPVCKERDLIRRDVGRSVIFRFRAPLDANTVEGSSISNASENTPSGQSSKGESSSIAPIYASDLLAQVLETAVTTPLGSGRHGKIHYYQGLHDIAAVILHSMDYDTQKATLVLRRLCQSHLRDALRENFGNITWLLSLLLMPLVEKIDANVHYALAISDVELSNVCLPWMITWFTHDIHNHAVAVRLVDAFIASHPMLPFYLSVAILTHPLLKREILAAGEAEDAGTMFVIIKSLTKSISADATVQDDRLITAQELIEDAIAIMQRIPPRSLLDLISADTYNRRELLEKAASISMFKAPSSWSMAGMTVMSGTLENGVVVPNYHTKYVRAKLASGVPCIMGTVQGAQQLCRSPTWGSRRHIHKKKRSIWEMYMRIIVSKLKYYRKSITSQ